MLAIADATPLHYLVLIGAEQHLPLLVTTVVIPDAVRAELAHDKTPPLVRAWILAPPPWTRVVPAAPALPGLPRRLGAGERAVLAYHAVHTADVLLLDDRDAVHFARRRGWDVLTTLGVLRALAARPDPPIDLHTSLTRLRATNFRVTEAQIEAVLRTPPSR